MVEGLPVYFFSATLRTRFLLPLPKILGLGGEFRFQWMKTILVRPVSGFQGAELISPAPKPEYRGFENLAKRRFLLHLFSPAIGAFSKGLEQVN